MAERKTPIPNWPCPQCGYNLVGLIPKEEMVRCPECGRISDHQAIIRANEERYQRASQLTIGLVIVATVFCGIILIRTLNAQLDPLVIAMILFSIAIAGVPVWWLWMRGLTPSLTSAVVFLAGLTVLLLMPDLVLGNFRANRFVILLWVGGFILYQFLREWRRIGDRY